MIVSPSNVSRNQLCPCRSGKKYKLCCGKASVQPLPRRAEKRSAELVVLVPTRGTISLETHRSLLSHMSGVDRVFLSASRMPVDKARNYLAAGALRARETIGCTYALWVDDDAAWSQGVVERMLQVLKSHPECDLLAGWFSKRAPMSPPCAWRSWRDLESFPRPGFDCEIGQVVEVERIGFHLVMHRISLLERLGTDPFESTDSGEDVAFCDRLRTIGGRLFVDTGSWIAHVETTTGDAFLPGSPALYIDDAGAFKTRGSSGVEHFYGAAVDEVVARRKALERAHASRAVQPD